MREVGGSIPPCSLFARLRHFLRVAKKNFPPRGAKNILPTMGLEPTILPLGGARLIHLATQAAPWAGRTGSTRLVLSLHALLLGRHLGRVVKAVDSKSTGLCPRQFESGRCRIFFFAVRAGSGLFAWYCVCVYFFFVVVGWGGVRASRSGVCRKLRGSLV